MLALITYFGEGSNNAYIKKKYSLGKIQPYILKQGMLYP